MQDNSKFYAHVLLWVREELDADATEVVAVSGVGSDYADGGTEEGFSADNWVEIKWWTNPSTVGALTRYQLGDRRILGVREVRGDQFQSLWHHVVSAWQAPDTETETA